MAHEQSRRAHVRGGASGWILALTLTFLFGAACAEGDTSDSTAEQASEQAVVTAEEGDPRLRACLEGAGYNYEEVYPPWNSHEPPPEDSVFADPAFWQDLEGCLHETGLSNSPTFDAARIASENRGTLKYVSCMRERGWALPDPEPWEGPPHPGLLTPVDALPPEHDREATDQYYRDSNDCGHPFYDENDNLLPVEG
ncbi:MAG: hypothetical protein M3323_06535 [Actinomycetota bacterium]|nr:hypothetical protein [Actinomycetota bacterium]